jgi:hypothetical protein
MSENSLHIVAGIVFLLPFSIMGGIIISWNLINVSKLIYLPFWIKLSVIAVIVFSVLRFYLVFNKLNKYFNNIYLWFFSNIWFLPISFNVSLTRFNLNLSNNFFKFVEITWSETLIFNYMVNIINNSYIRKFIDFISYIYIIQIIEIFVLFLILLLRLS